MEALQKNHSTNLTAWFDLNKSDESARQFLYSEIPEHYVWTQEKRWKTRVRQRKPLLNRLYFVSPRQQERFHLRLLLLHVRGATSLEDLRTFEGITYSSYKEAAQARDLIAQDDEWDKCLQEAAIFKFPQQLTELFAYILVFQRPTNARQLYEKYKEHFFDSRMTPSMAEFQCLHTIKEIANTHNCNIEEFNFPQMQYEEIANTVIDDNDNINEERLINSLNNNQRRSFDEIAHATNNPNANKLFFIDGPGGSGKSYLHNVIIKVLKKRNIEVLAMAWTGIAAILLEGGQTVHSAIQLPLNLNETTVCGIKVNSPRALKILNKKVIIWDEISMANVYAFNAVDRFLQDLCQNDQPFGGKIMIVSGDFRQILPIIPRGKRAHIVKLCVKNSKLWQYFKKHHLHENMRVKNDNNGTEFKRWLLTIGEGKTYNKFEKENDLFAIPAELLTENNIIDEIYGNNIRISDESVHEKVILAPRIADVLELNNKIIAKLEGRLHNYYSTDYMKDDDETEAYDYFPTEFMNSLTPNGLPPHNLQLKIGAIVILLRNMNIANGLCNGTRLKIIDVGSYVLTARIISGIGKGKIIMLPRIELTPSEEDVPFQFVRRQYPIRIGYAVTINRAQGQSYDHVGVLLTLPVFSHGQLYVAASRSKYKSNLKFSISDDANYTERLWDIKKKGSENNTPIWTKNIVYQEVLE